MKHSGSPSLACAALTDATFGATSSSQIVPIPLAEPQFADAVSVIVSERSARPSSTVGTLTWNVVAPAGTVTLAPLTATKFLPPSNETCRPARR